MPIAHGDRNGVRTSTDFSTSARTGSFEQNTSACGLAFSARRRFARRVDFVSSVSTLR